MRRNARQEAINRLREQQNAPLRGKMFDERFTRTDNFFDKVEAHPVRSVLGFWLVALLLNLVFWGLMIVLGLWILGQFGVI